MKAKHIVGLLVVFFGLWFGWTLISAQFHVPEAVAQAVVFSGQVVTVQDFSALAETAVEIGSSPEPGPVVILLGSPHPFMVEVAGEEIWGVEVVNNFGIPNSYRIVTSLKDDTIAVREGSDISMLVFTNTTEGRMAVTPNFAEIQGILWVGYLCAGALIAMGLWIALD